MRVAWLYYVEGKTQGQIAEELGVHRVRVNRDLAASRETGLVQFHLNGELAGCVALERSLVSLYGLREALVVPTPGRAALIAPLLGQALGRYVSSQLRPGMTVGVGWGRTLRWSIQALRAERLPGLTVVSLMGGVGRASELNTYETASRFAERYNALCYYVAAPTFVASPELREMLLDQVGLRSVCERGRNADMTVVSVGSLTPRSTIVEIGLLSPEEMRSLAAAGAVGDLLCHFIGADGAVVDHPLNRRVVGVSPVELTNVGKRVVAGGGRDKLAVLRAVLAGRYADVLVTDRGSAAALCRESAINRSRNAATVTPPGSRHPPAGSHR